MSKGSKRCGDLHFTHMAEPRDAQSPIVSRDVV
jgi:hypothetical protein